VISKQWNIEVHTGKRFLLQLYQPLVVRKFPEAMPRDYSMLGELMFGSIGAKGRAYLDQNVKSHMASVLLFRWLINI